MSREVDVLIVGGGPAGSSTAFWLARRGARVRVLERARFPRPKPCAECLSPQASRILADMGVLSDLERQGVWLKGMSIRAPNGVVARGDYGSVQGFRPYRDAGLAIRRECLDATLLDRARSAGADVVERVRVVDVLRRADGSLDGVRTMTPGGAVQEVRARLVIGADGLRSVVARRLGLARASVWPRRLSLVARYRGVDGMSDQVELHVEPDGFVGLADVGFGSTTVAAVFPMRRARELGRDASGFLDRWLAGKRHLAPRFAGSRRESRASAIGPFASHARRAWFAARGGNGGGALLVGDAADFFDPFTGEGIYAALRGGELASESALRALGATGRRGMRGALGEYDVSRRREFAGKWWVERLIGTGVAHPPIVNRAVRALARRKELADLLVGVTGDFVPANRVLRWSYISQLFIDPPPFFGANTACR